MIPMMFDGTKCPFCGVIVGGLEFVARSAYLWSNQHGYAKRIFCSRCNHWTDYVDKGEVICTRWRDEHGNWHSAADDSNYHLDYAGV